ncbi:dTDP-4-dehydrorhamnose reductase [Vagococcus zengguangii]|uniref:dTDP-4-dehydrorhamnose reductase n=1 Tax=Vagococcus zengguangii TaxID=2571750 RepID=A0A4D7CX70_9ENTE|nr:dTDP-4-dehydrorhamnose reductase [Vagococcus zengguangii]QCI87007.1 dTDP-4-dehydrorhamnose reductase [Vagococcus zengguangii]
MILITGANGQLGTEVTKLLEETGLDYVATDSKDLDITDKEVTLSRIEEIQPKVIFHCAAYTAVDMAEDEGRELNQLVNVVGTRNVAEAAQKVGAKLVYISTDYVFDGTKKDGEYTVEDVTNPKNEYGRAKLEGELAVKELLDDYYIIRTSWVFGQYGKNFVFTMQNLATKFEQLTVVADQFGRPTWTRSLAEFMLYASEQAIPFGTYHFSNDDSCSWYEFASEILKDEEVEVKPVTSEEYPQKAYRPKYSIMDLSKVKGTGFNIINWQEALEKFKGSAQQ